MAIRFPRLEHPIVQAPMAGGPSTPALAAAVSDAGGLGFLAAGYRTTAQLRHDIGSIRQLTPAPFGVNLFVLTETEVDPAAISAYARTLEPDAHRLGASVGEARFDDDELETKLELVLAERVPIVSFTFGCPQPEVIARLHERGIVAWATVTDLSEARLAAERGVDALVVQGAEAGGHRATFQDTGELGEIALLPLLRLIARELGLPLIASGAIADGPGVAAAMAAGAYAVQVGTAFMRCPEAATTVAHRAALLQPTSTAITRAFTGRRARGLVNRFMKEHPDAPAAYPHVHHLTAPLRAAARSSGDADSVNLWAGEAHALAQARPAGELVREWSLGARRALDSAAARIQHLPEPIQRPLLVLQHIACEPPAAYEDELLAWGAELHRVMLNEGEALPDWREFAGIIAMGGPMGAYEDERLPWLEAEKRLIAEAVTAGTPYWGVCLGAQLLAASLGARVYRGPDPEVGVLPVFVTEAAAGDPVFAHAPAEFVALQWHADTFELPAGGVRLARSAAYEQQAFVVGRAYALQFHLEVDSALAQRWGEVPAYAASLTNLLGDGALPWLVREVRRREGETVHLGRNLFAAWLEHVVGLEAPAQTAP